MILFEEPTDSAGALTALEDSIEVNFEDLIDEEEALIFAEDDEPNRCLSGFYAGTHSERGLRCVRPAGDHRHHLSEKDWWGVSQLWEDHQPETTFHYLERPRRKLFGGRYRSKRGSLGRSRPARRPRSLEP